MQKTGFSAMLLKFLNLQKLHKSSFFYLILNTTYNFADKSIGAIFVVYLQGFRLSHFQIGILMSISSWLTCLLDFPTGNISDLKGRKKTTLLGLSIFGIGLIIYGSGSFFWQFIIALSLMGAGYAFISGAKEAWYTDDLKNNEPEHYQAEAAKVFALSNGLSYTVSAFCGIFVSFLIVFSMRLPFLVGGISCCMAAAICSFYMKENYGCRDEKYIVFFKNTFRYFQDYKAIRFFIYIKILSGVGFVYFILTWQPYLIAHGLSPKSIGLIFTLMMLAVGGTAFILAKVINEKNCLLLSLLGIILLMLSFLLMYLSRSLAAAILTTICFQVALSITMSAHTVWINLSISSTRRASVLSAISTFSEVSLALFFLLLGFLIEKLSLRTGLIIPVATYGWAALLIYKIYKMPLQKDL